MHTLKKLKAYLSGIDRPSRIFGFLVLITIVKYVFLWPIAYLSKGSIWIYGGRILPQFKYFSPAIDGGYFEHFQYILLIWCSALSFLIFLRQSKFTFPISIIYFYLFIDDSLSLHESVLNSRIEPLLENTFLNSFKIISLHGFAELIYWLIIFLICLLICYPSYIYCDSKSKKFIINNFPFRRIRRIINYFYYMYLVV